MILAKHKNALLTLIQESDFDPKLFASEYGTIADKEFFIIELRNSPMRFALRALGDFDRFKLYHSTFSPGFPLTGPYGNYDIEGVYIKFKEWLDTVVKPYLDELNTPDLWQTIVYTNSEAKCELGTPDSLEPFSEEEKIQLRLSINEFRLLLVKNFNPNKDELAAISDRLEYLSDAMDKHNKFDWKGIAIHTVITIIVTLALNPEQSQQLFQLFKQVFSNIIYLLP